MKKIVVLFAKLDIGQPQSTLHSALQCRVNKARGFVYNVHRLRMIVKTARLWIRLIDAKRLVLSTYLFRLMGFSGICITLERLS